MDEIRIHSWWEGEKKRAFRTVKSFLLQSQVHVKKQPFLGVLFSCHTE